MTLVREEEPKGRTKQEESYGKMLATRTNITAATTPTGTTTITTPSPSQKQQHCCCYNNNNSNNNSSINTTTTTTTTTAATTAAAAAALLFLSSHHRLPSEQSRFRTRVGRVVTLTMMMMMMMMMLLTTMMMMLMMAFAAASSLRATTTTTNNNNNNNTTNNTNNAKSTAAIPPPFATTTTTAAAAILTTAVIAAATAKTRSTTIAATSSSSTRPTWPVAAAVVVVSLLASAQIASAGGGVGGDTATEAAGTLKNFYSFTAKDINGDTVHLSKYKGMVTLVVNVASECGFTHRNYEALVQLQSTFIEKKFSVLAFPCNQFGDQEPGDDWEIESFVEKLYGLNFPLFSKINVIGSYAASSWKYLAKSSGKEPNWNFWKYLVGRDGLVTKVWGPKTSFSEIYRAIQDVLEGKLLKKNIHRTDL